MANDNLAHACDVTANGKYILFNISFDIFSSIETSRNSSESSWLLSSLSPIIEAVQNVIDVAKSVQKAIQSFIDYVKYVTEQVNDLIKAVTSMIEFIMSLPAKYLQMLANCLSTLTQLLANCVSLTTKASKANTSSSNTSTTVA
mgnify:CR=1 FL=1